ncbi:autotransporter outer membrane beta-barrel domain-containing protein, partial [Bartonella acomydis]|uniref:autotransporter outer membrane beta-barrel domain-containing protein n=1 Tax=Bartonella acomydis TaxID=686234 RepID=UPI0031F04F34
MVKIFKNRLSLCAFTTVILFFAHNASSEVQANTDSTDVKLRAVVNGVGQDDNNAFVCDTNLFCWFNEKNTLLTIVNETYQKTTGNAKEAALRSSEEAGIIGKDITIKDASSTDKLNGSFWKYGIIAENRGKVNIEGGVIDLTDGIGVQSKKGYVTLKKVSIGGKASQAVNRDFHSGNSVFQMKQKGGYIELREDNIKVTDIHGVSFQGELSYMDMFNSTVVVEGNTSYGLRFFEDDVSEEEQQKTDFYYVKEKVYSFFGEKKLFGNLPKEDLPKRGSVYLFDTTFKVPNSMAIYSKKSAGLIKLSGKSEISGDILLKAEDGSFIKVAAHNSTLLGGVNLDEDSSAEFRLTGGSKWTLSQPKNENLQVSGSRGISSISLIHLIDSSIVFQQPEVNIADGYQTLYVGKGEGVVYRAQGNARLYLNTYLNKGGALQNQKTDRLLIHGDVEGKTIVHVHGVSESPGGGTGHYENNKGISIIQVSGKAEKDSFKLDGDYVALDGLPYQYSLRAYGPSSELGKASDSQRLVEGKGDFWDFRLENGSIHSVTKFYHLDRGRHSGQGVKAVVPQVPTYLLLPNSIFHAGLMDISNQNKQLEIQRSISGGMLDIGTNSASFLR